MDSEYLSAALPADKTRDLRDTIGESLIAKGVTVVDIQDGAIRLRDAKIGRGQVQY